MLDIWFANILRFLAICILNSLSLLRSWTAEKFGLVESLDEVFICSIVVVVVYHVIPANLEVYHIQTSSSWLFAYWIVCLCCEVELQRNLDMGRVLGRCIHLCYCCCCSPCKASYQLLLTIDVIGRSQMLKCISPSNLVVLFAL